MNVILNLKIEIENNYLVSEFDIRVLSIETVSIAPTLDEHSNYQIDYNQ